MELTKKKKEGNFQLNEDSAIYISTYLIYTACKSFTLSFCEMNGTFIIKYEQLHLGKCTMEDLRVIIYY